jgi:CBS domain-containing protein
VITRTESLAPRRELTPIKRRAVRRAMLGSSSATEARAMFSQPVGTVMNPGKLLLGSPGDSVAMVAKAMARRKVGAIAIVDGERLVGIFTERDALTRVTIGPADPFGRALVIMNRKGCRHLPVVDGGRVVGMVSSRAALDPKMEEFRSETERRRHFAG